VRNEVGVSELAGGAVDRDLKLAQGGTAELPDVELTADFAKNPIADRDHEASVLGHFQKIVGRNQAVPGCCQRSKASRPTTVWVSSCMMG